MSVSDPLINRVFDGRYRIVRKLGAGGMANVYLAEDQELGRRVAIKILNDRHANDDQFVERFRREAKNAAGLSHPNIVSIYDRGEAEGTYYIAMEYLDGRSVKELIVRDGPLPVATAIDYARQILAAIGFAHRHGIVHRDIKPHNVLVAGDERLKVTDFGIARSGASQMTEVGSIIGTAQYLSPEQARGAPVDQTSDLYSLGVVLYEMLTGVVPFTGDTPLEIAMKHLSAVPEPPSSKRPGIPHDLDLIVLRALAKRQEDRYQSADEMDADLARVAHGAGVSPQTTEAATAVLAGAGTVSTAPTTISRAPTTVMPPRAPAPPGYVPPGPYYGYQGPRRRRVWPWVLLVALVAAAGGGGFYLYTYIRDRIDAAQPVSVPFVEGLRELQAATKIREKGLTPRIRRQPNERVEVSFVFDQTPAAGERIDKGNSVTIFVSTGVPQTVVPSVLGKSVADAVGTLADRHLKARVFEINSEKPAGTVIAQEPKPGRQLTQGARVRINVSKGPKPVVVPAVVGQTYDQAAARLRDAGFLVLRTTVDSAEPAGTVLREIPAAGSEQARGAKITLIVSKGPATFAVPDVTGLDRRSAAVTLRNAGFAVDVSLAETINPTQNGIVLNQDPAPGSQEQAKTSVTIIVGEYVGQTVTTVTDTTPTETAPTDTTPTDTVPTDTVPTDTTPTDTIPTDTVPTDTVPTDTVPTDTIPTDTVPTDTVPADTTPVTTQPLPPPR